MKHLYRIICVVLVAAGLCSCKDFLETNPTSSVADSEVFTTINGAQAALNGCYYHLFLGSGGSGRQDDWGYATHLMTFSVDGEDLIVWGGWYGYDYNFWGHTRGDIFKSSCLWYYYYILINNCNSVIAYVDDVQDGEESEKNAIKGQALAMRGWAYFHLIRLYQQTYVIAKDMPGVPIYTEPTTDTTEGKGRGTVQQTYDQILSDLTQAESLLAGFTRSDKNLIDQSVARAFLAQVYLTMNDWEKAASYAASARASYPLTTNDEYYEGFHELNTPSWMWGMYQTKEQNLGDYSPFAMWANWLVRDGDYGWTFQCFFLNDVFVNYFEDGDVRKDQFHWVWDCINYSDKFYDDTDLCGDIVYMRSEEMLLTQAEALARQGKDSEAQALLNELQSMRGANPTSASGDELIEAILLERRKELYGEGLEWFDLIRNQKPLLREGDHASYGGHDNNVFPLAAHSWRFIYQIPNTEIVNNPNMSSEIWPAGDQNPFSGIYTP